MLILAVASLLLSLRAPSPAHLPQAKKPATTKPQDPIRKWMDAPVYYMSYHMHFDGSLSRSGYTATETRDVDGTITLALHSPGPSLSAQTAIHAGMDTNELSNWGTWMAGGVPPDEPQTDANFLKYGKQWVNDWTGSVNFHSEQTNQVMTKTGSGQVVNSSIQPTLEIDSKGKKFRARVPFLFQGASENGAHVEVVTDVDTTKRDDYLWLSGPDLKGVSDADIYGSLPTSGAISCQQSFPAVAYDVPGTVTITVVFSPTKAEQVELIVNPPKDYDDWRPLGGMDEEDQGNSITVDAHLQKVGGGVPLLKKIQKIEAKLLYTSNEKGVCMNWPLVADASLPLDMKFVQSANKDYLIDDKGQKATDTTPKDFDASVTVTSFDYGGTAELQIVATLNNGEQITGKVKGTSDQTLYLPKRAKPNGFIALSYLKKYGVQSLSDNDDSEDKPEGNGFNGDGLTLYEEYRGFMEGGKWMTCNPKRKELMVVNEMPGEPHTWKGIAIYEAATKIKVHKKFHAAETDSNNVINFNHTMRPHVVDQHVLFISRGKNLSDGETAARVRKVGTPKVAVDVSMPPDWTKWLKTARGYQPDYAITIAHEMMHGSSVRHHGETDQRGLVWFYDATPAPHWIEQTGRYDKNTGRWVLSGPETSVILKRENGHVIPPADGKWFPDVWLTTPGGQHSGDNECIMKYNCATGYPAGAEPNTRYVTGDEYAGVILCTGQSGTGVNDPNRSLPVGNPQSRQGPADRGDCVHQLCINDLYTPPSPALTRTDTNGLIASINGARLPLKQDAQDDVIEPSTPMIVVGANDVSGQQIKPGWPIIVSATLIGSDGSASAIPAGLTPKLTNSSGKAIALSFAPLPSNGSDKTLTYWIANEGSTSGLLPGEYIINLTGTTTQIIAPTQISVKTGDEINDDNKSLLNIQILLISGKTDDALHEADQLISANPSNVMALSARGDILMAKGDSDGAMAAYSQALSLLDQSNTEGENGSDELSENLQLHMRLRDAMKAALDAMPGG